MASLRIPSFTREMNKSLETKLALYQNMAEYVKRRPVIFTSRAEIWSTDRSPVIITGHPFPYVAPNNNPNQGDVTREMMKYYRNLPADRKKGRHHLNLILFEIQANDSTEVHAIFSPHESYGANEKPADIYLKKNPAKVLTRQCSTELNSEKTLKTSVPIIFEGEGVHLVRAIRSVSLTMTLDEDRDMVRIEFRLGQELCDNLIKKVQLFQDNATSDVHGVTFTSIPYLWHKEIPWLVIKDRLPRIPTRYDHKRFDIEEDILQYVTQVARRNNCAPFYAYSRTFADGEFADVHLLFTRYNKLPSLSLDSGVTGPPVPPRSQATIERHAEVDELASGAGLPLSFESASSDSAPFCPPPSPRIKVTLATNPEEESKGESQSSDSARIKGLAVPPGTSAKYRRYSTSDETGGDQSLSSDSPRSGLNLVMGEYRRYSSSTKEGVPGDFISNEVQVERSVTSSSSKSYELSAESLDEGDDNDRISSHSPNYDAQIEEIRNEYRKVNEMLQWITPRLGCRLLNNLDAKLQVYADRPPEAQYSTFIFTNNRRMWKTVRNPIIKITELPPIPPHETYNHETNDIVQDIVDYMRMYYMILKLPDWEPIYVAILRIGTGPDTEVHILLAQHPETASQYYLFSQLGPTLSPVSSRAHSAPAKALQTSAGDAMATRQARSTGDSLDNLPDLTSECVFPRNPDEYVP